MALTDDINNLPEKPEDSVSGHLNHHSTIHESLKDHEERLNDTVSTWYALVMKALSMGRRNAKAVSDLAAQSPSDSDISDIVSGINTELDTKADKSELETKADKSEVATQLDIKADKSEVSDVNAFSLRALATGRKNTKTIKDLTSRVADKADKDEVENLTTLTLSALSMGKKNTKAVSDLENRTPDSETGIPIPPGGIPGQVLMLTESGWTWTWADRHPATYHDKY